MSEILGKVVGDSAYELAVEDGFNGTLSQWLDSLQGEPGFYDDTEVKNSIIKLDNDKQDNLVSGTNIKTINNQPILGAGNINIEGGSGDVSIATATKAGVLYAHYDPVNNVLRLGTTPITGV